MSQIHNHMFHNHYAFLLKVDQINILQNEGSQDSLIEMQSFAGYYLN